LNIPHIPDRDLLHIMCLTELDHLMAGFMQNVTLLAVHSGAGPRLAFQQPAMTLRSSLAARNQ
jgi:hypothetical protein